MQAPAITVDFISTLSLENTQHTPQAPSVVSSCPTTNLSLGQLQVGESGKVSGYRQGSKSYRQKLLAMGLTRGTPFTVVRRAPLGDPLEIQVRGFFLSLRKQEAHALIIEKL